MNSNICEQNIIFLKTLTLLQDVKGVHWKLFDRLLKLTSFPVLIEINTTATITKPVECPMPQRIPYEKALQFPMLALSVARADK